MSYILEALKKAQAERQLGSAPTIHAPQPAAPPDAASGGRPRALLLGLGGGALVIAAGALVLWRGGGRDVSPSAVPATAAQTAPPVAPPIPPARAVPPPVPPAPAPADTLAVEAPPEPVRVARAADDARVTSASALKKEAAPAPAAGAPVARAGTAPQPEAQAQAQPQPQPAAPAAEDSLPFLQQLPPALQQQVPRVAFGGYMYSSNPADRLLLVDKTLRHEGEEVAPGLVLEKLLPKAAVMNFRGVRYRVAY